MLTQVFWILIHKTNQIPGISCTRYWEIQLKTEYKLGPGQASNLKKRKKKKKVLSCISSWLQKGNRRKKAGVVRREQEEEGQEEEEEEGQKEQEGEQEVRGGRGEAADGTQEADRVNHIWGSAWWLNSSRRASQGGLESLQSSD